MKVALRGDVWERLFPHVDTLMNEVRRYGGVEPIWTFGGGTVLMLRHNHRYSHDIDIFVPDPQYLGYVTPRLSEVAEEVTADYVEQANFVKLVLVDGEIDIVAAKNLTADPYEIWDIMGKPVRVETAAEIVAKKIYHRGDRATARDLFDLAMVIDQAAESLAPAAPFLCRHARKFVARVEHAPAILREQFAAIRRIDFQRNFDECVDLVRPYLMALIDDVSGNP